MTKKLTTRKRGRTVELDDGDIRKLKMLAAELDIPMKALSKEAIQLLFKKYKKK